MIWHGHGSVSLDIKDYLSIGGEPNRKGANITATKKGISNGWVSYPVVWVGRAHVRETKQKHFAIPLQDLAPH